MFTNNFFLKTVLTVSFAIGLLFIFDHPSVAQEKTSGVEVGNGLPVSVPDSLTNANLPIPEKQVYQGTQEETSDVEAGPSEPNSPNSVMEMDDFGGMTTEDEKTPVVEVVNTPKVSSSYVMEMITAAEKAEKEKEKIELEAKVLLAEFIKLRGWEDITASGYYTNLTVNFPDVNILDAAYGTLFSEKALNGTVYYHGAWRWAEYFAKAREFQTACQKAKASPAKQREAAKKFLSFLYAEYQIEIDEYTALIEKEEQSRIYWEKELQETPQGVWRQGFIKSSISNLEKYRENLKNAQNQQALVGAEILALSNGTTESLKKIVAKL